MRLLNLLTVGGVLLASVSAYAQGASSELPRNETLIVENPEGTIRNAGWFNIWAVNAGGQSTGLHQLAMDTFWYIDPEHGIDGVWDNSLAAEPPIYNADFTEMTVKLRPGIFWSDGSRVHGRRCRVHHRDASEDERPRSERPVSAQRGQHRSARSAAPSSSS